MGAPHARRGVGNTQDFICRYLRCCLGLGAYLDLESQRLDMTPVDFVARSIVALLYERADSLSTYHLTNIEQSMSYAAIGRAMLAAGYSVAPYQYDRFRRELTTRQALSRETEELRSLAGYFPEYGFALEMGPWPSEISLRALAKLGVVRPAIDGGYIERAVAWLQRAK